VTVIDSSALTCFLLHEEGWARVQELLSRDPISVDLLRIECSNAILRARRDGRIPSPEAEAALRDLLAIAGYGVPLTPSEDLLPEAWKIGCEDRLSIYDALFLALAKVSGRPIATNDRKQKEAAVARGIEVESF
jgi:predicted nucleic acid-binding protein